METTKEIAPKEKAKKVRLKPAVIYELGPTHVTQIDGISVSLTDQEVKGHRAATPKTPAMEVISKPATQAQLRKLYEQGHPLLEEYDPE